MVLNNLVPNPCHQPNDQECEAKADCSQRRCENSRAPNRRCRCVEDPEQRLHPVVEPNSKGDREHREQKRGRAGEPHADQIGHGEFLEDVDIPFRASRLCGAVAWLARGGRWLVAKRVFFGFRGGCTRHAKPSMRLHPPEQLIREFRFDRGQVAFGGKRAGGIDDYRHQPGHPFDEPAIDVDPLDTVEGNVERRPLDDASTDQDPVLRDSVAEKPPPQHGHADQRQHAERNPHRQIPAVP